MYSMRPIIPPDNQANMTVLTWAWRSRLKTSGAKPCTQSGKTNSKARTIPMRPPTTSQAVAVSMKFLPALFSLLNIPPLHCAPVSS
jgi:hypothetical protein